MYTTFYKLDDYPFQLTPDVRFYFDSGPHKKALAYLTYGLNKGEGFIVMTGDIGAGKTTLMDHLIHNNWKDKKNIRIARVMNTQLEATDLLRSVASAFGLTEVYEDKSAILRQIEAVLTENRNHRISSLLFVDEAQNLSESALEELRMLSNFQDRQRPILQIILVGQPEFRGMLAKDNMEQLRQRIIVYYHLEALDAPDTRAYIEHRLKMAGWQDDPMFTEYVFERIFEESNGVPRKINLVCDRMLLFGYLAEKHVIGSSDFDQVMREMREEILAPNRGSRQGPELIYDRAESGEINPLVNHPSELDRIIQRVHDLEVHIRRQKKLLEAATSKLGSSATAAQ